MKHPGVRNIGSIRRRKIKQELLQKQLSKCAICHKAFRLSDKITFDHIFPLAKGANNHDNLQIVHFHCNQEKADAYDQKET